MAQFFAIFLMLITSAAFSTDAVGNADSDTTDLYQHMNVPHI